MSKDETNKKEEEWDMQGAPPATRGFWVPSSGVPSMSSVPNSGIPSMSGMGSGGMGSSEPSNSLRKYSFDTTTDQGGWDSSLVNDPLEVSHLDAPNNTGNDDINFGGQSILPVDHMVNRYEMSRLFVGKGDEKAGNLPPSGPEWKSILSPNELVGSNDGGVDMEELGGGRRRRSRKRRTRRIKKKGGGKGKRPDTPPSRTRRPNRRQQPVASSINRSAPSITRRLTYRRPLPRIYAITNPIGDSESTMRIRSLDQIQRQQRRQRRRGRLGIARTRRSLNEAIDDENVKQENVADPPPQEPSFNKENQGGPDSPGGSGSGGITAGGRRRRTRRRRTKRRKKRRSRRTRKHRKKGTRRSRKKRRKSRRR